ncbi:MAG: ABC transporter ATP-binding protein [Verrucomicrobiales bacterium]|nr:ABC transporter ATP-binding protein [Verrucomicrobiales bacterium]
MPLLEVKNLKTHFHTRDGIVRAVDGVSFPVEKGKTIGIVGESGSGKSVTCYSLLGLVPMPPGKIEEGSAIFDHTDLLKCQENDLCKIRGKRISMIFQDPMTSLNPYLRISTQITEPLRIHMGMDKKRAKKEAIDALREVGIPEPEKRVNMYPHEFSGGMRQRAMIAMALITKPEILIADEPTTALDVTVQKQILELIKSRQEELGTAVIFITHDLAVISEICDEVNVMYAGKIVERANSRELFSNPLHAYTRSLLQSIPATQLKGEKLFTISGLPPNLAEPIQGCAFRPRNQIGNSDECLTQSTPEFKEIVSNHWVQNCPGCLT